MNELEPRKIYYLDENDAEQIITITFVIEGTRTMFEGEFGPLLQRSGYIKIDSEILSLEASTQGFDDIQMLYRMMKLTDMFLRTRSVEAGIELYTLEKENVRTPFAMFE